jgi:hypothetical protein
MFIGKMVSARETTGSDLVISRFMEMEPIILATIERPNGRTCEPWPEKSGTRCAQSSSYWKAEGDAWTAQASLNRADEWASMRTVDASASAGTRLHK